MTAKTPPEPRELEPLPIPALIKSGPGGQNRRDYFTADDMRAHALQAREAEQARWQELLKDSIAFTWREAQAEERDKFVHLLRQALEVLENHRSEHAQGRIAGVVHAIRQRLEEAAA